MEQFTQEMLKRLDALAGKLGMAATALWGFYLRQAIITGVSELIGTVVAGVVFALLLRFGIRCYKKGEATPKNEYGNSLQRGNYLTAGVWLVAASVGFLLLACFLLYFGVSAVANPGYWAFQTIVEQLKGQ